MKRNGLQWFNDDNKDIELNKAVRQITVVNNYFNGLFHLFRIKNTKESNKTNKFDA